MFRRPQLGLPRIFGLILVSLGCKAGQKPLAIEPIDRLVSLEKTGCLGDCPVYTLEIYDDGTIRLEARRHLDLSGVHTDKLSPEELDRTVQALDEARLPQLNDLYDNRVTDAPFTIVTYRGKTIRCRGDAPPQLGTVVTTLEGLLDNRSWTDVAANQREVILDLPGGQASIDVLVHRYGDYSLQLQRRLGPRSTFYLFTLTVEESDAEALLERLRAEEGVQNAQWNHRLHRRDR